MQHPSLSINLRCIEDNARTLVGLCGDKGVIPVGISSLVEMSEPIAKAVQVGGIRAIGDTQLYQLKKMAALPLRKILLRRCLQCEVDEVISHTDISLHSEREVLEALSRAAVKADKCHQVIIVHDLDYLCEAGLDDSETESLAELVLALPGLVLAGISSYLDCYSAVEYSAAHRLPPACQAALTGWAGASGLKAGSARGMILMMPGLGVPRLNHLRSGRSSIVGIGLKQYLDQRHPEISDQPASGIG